MKTQPKSALIIGSGIAGLATSIRLQSAGIQTTVFEKNTYPGGKLTAFSEKGYRFDMGPSLFTMPHFIEELFTVAQKDITKYFEYHQKDTVCHYFFEDGTEFQAKADANEFAENAEAIFDVKKSDILNYFDSSKKKYDLTASLFLEKSLHRKSTYLSKDTIKAILSVGALDINTNLHQHNSKRFSDKRLVQFFDRFATYNGSDPYQTPGIMSMIPHLEQYFGTFFPKGGMHSITQSLYQLAQDIGVKFHFETEVDEIIVENGKATGIRTKGNVINADIVVTNSDVVPSYRGLLRTQKAPEKILRQPRSSSALIFYWGIKKEFPQLDLHNIFFSKDYKAEFHTIFQKENVIDDPTVYINITSKEEKADAPEGCENWFVMINTPSNKGQDWEEIIERSRQNIIRKLSDALGVNLADLIEFESILDPRSIEKKTNSYQGALYGAASNNKFAAFLRHPNFTNKIDNLYFCGGSVHPGGGIPLCLLSGKIVSELILKK
ncbi:MAG: phytoene dehydrogenase [Flavobacteriaceae bacterium]|nr:phytoene dehydrogenase [Flavobacteriaceae bacterium]